MKYDSQHLHNVSVCLYHAVYFHSLERCTNLVCLYGSPVFREGEEHVSRRDPDSARAARTLLQPLAGEGRAPSSARHPGALVLGDNGPFDCKIGVWDEAPQTTKKEKPLKFMTGCFRLTHSYCLFCFSEILSGCQSVAWHPVPALSLSAPELLRSAPFKSVYQRSVLAMCCSCSVFLGLGVSVRILAASRTHCGGSRVGARLINLGFQVAKHFLQHWQQRLARTEDDPLGNADCRREAILHTFLI